MAVARKKPIKKQQRPEVPDFGKADTPKVSGDQLEKIRGMVRMARDLGLRKKDIDDASKEVGREINELRHVKLPTIMDEVGIERLTIAPEGNLPGVEARCEPYYHANIPASWDDEKREAAFKWLEDNGHGDLIKAQYVVLLPKGDRKAQRAVEKALSKLNVPYETSLSVPWATLTVWLREQVEKFGTVPPLDVIGGNVGRVVKLTEKKKD